VHNSNSQHSELFKDELSDGLWMFIRVQTLGLDWLCACGVLDHSIVAPGLKLSPPAEKNMKTKLNLLFDKIAYVPERVK
jgi:hypothetical protein